MERITSHLRFLKESASSMVQYLSGKQIPKISLFSMGMLRRVADIAIGTEPLCRNFGQEPHYDFSIGLLFRTLLLDVLISMNMLNKIHELEAQGKNSEETQSELEKLCDIFLADGLKQTLSYIKDEERLFNPPPEEIASAFINMVRLFKPYFQDYSGDGSMPILKNKNIVTAKCLFETLAKTEKLQEVSKLYRQYTYLSKYEHFGILYYHTINEPLKVKCKIYEDSVRAFVAHNSLLHSVLARDLNGDEFINQQKQIADDYLLNEVIKKPMYEE